MRIMMLSQFYPPIIGGTEQHVWTLSVELVSRGHDVVVITMQQGNLLDFEVSQGVRIYRVRSSTQRIPLLFSDNKRQQAPPFPDIEVMLELRRLILREQPQIIHAHNWFGRSFLPLKAWSGAKLIITVHDYALLCAKKTLIYHGTPCNGPSNTKCLRCASQHYGVAKGIPIVLSNWIMRRIEQEVVDKFLAVSHATIIGNGLIDSQIPYEVIPNFIPDDMNALSEATEPYLAQLPTEDYLLFVGTLGHVKGIDVLLHAYTELTDPPPLVLIGYQTSDFSLSASSCPNNVFIFTDWPHEAVMGAWSRCLIGLIPSIWAETFGIVALEAMSMGKPVIASRIGGLTDVVSDGETGLLIPPGDEQALKEAIQCLLDDPIRRKQMGQIAKQKVVEFQAKSVVPRIEQVYREVLAF